jgi:hypothetical protein
MEQKTKLDKPLSQNSWPIIMCGAIVSFIAGEISENNLFADKHL